MCRRIGKVKIYKLVIADDESWILEGLRDCMDWKSLGFEIVGAFEDSEAALQFCISHEVDAVLSDINMPQMTGLDFIKKLRESGKDHIQVVFITGYALFEYAKTAISIGASDYLLKPLNPDDIKKAFEKVRMTLDRIGNHQEEIRRMEKLAEEFEGTHAGLCKEVVQYLAENYAQDISMPQLASCFQISQNYLGKVFQQTSGMNIRACLNEIRIEKAENLLKTGRYRMYEVAEMVGFSNYDYFRKIYKQYKTKD